MAERLVFDILANDRASAGFARAGKSAAAASDDVLGLARRLDEVSRKTANARVGLQGNKEALAQLDQLDHKLLITGRKVTPEISIDGAERASLEITKLDAQLDALGAKSAGAEAAVGGGGLSGPSGLGALIGAGVALSPQLTAIGFGLGGLGLAAAGVVGPIEKAAHKAGGLQKNMHDLNPEQQAVARGLLALGRDYSDFQQMLQPEVFGVFNHGLSIAGHLLHDIEPISAAAGKALGGVLGQVDAEFQSGTWQSFFGFLAREAGPDLRMVGNVLTDALDVLPPLLRDLQPLGDLLLKDADATAKFAGDIASAVNWLGKLKGGSDEAGHSQSRLGAAFHEAAQQSYPELNVFGKIRDYLFGTSDAADKAGKSASGPAASGFHAMSNQAITAGTSVATLNSDLEHLNNLLSDQSAQIQWRQAQQAAAKAIRDTSGALDGNSKTALANRQLVIQSTQEALNFAEQERKTGGNVQGAARTIQDQIRWLIGLHDKSKWVRDELRLLRKAEDDLRSKHLDISVHGDGTWNVKGAGVGHGIPPGGSQPGAAAGMRVTAGTTPTADDVLARVSKGETIVSAAHSALLAPVFRAVGVPGYASGGVVGSYHDGLPGLGPWMGREYAATQRAIGDAVAAAFKAAKPPPGSIGPFPGGGASGPGPAAAQAYALGILPAYGWGLQQMLPLIALWNQESGWRWNATNPTSGAYGIPQSLPADKMAAAGPDWMTNPATQIRWGLGYIKSVYGSPAAAEAHELAFNWYDQGGYLPPGLSVAMNGTGKPEPVGAVAGTVININVTVGPTAHPRDVGREIVRAIREFEKGSGKGWRS